jgi:speckle-type POZ protein
VIQNGDCFTIRCDFTLVKAPSGTTPVQLDVVAPPSDLHRHLGALLLAGDGADVMFQVGQEPFHAHRCVLASRSPVFKAEFFGAMKEGSPKGAVPVRVDGVEAQAFGAFLHFVYTDALPDIGDEEETSMAQHLLVLADRYDMERLKMICDGKLRKRIDVSSAATTLALAEQHRCCCHGLKEACLDFLDLPGNLKAVESTDGFDHLATSCPAVLREIIAKLAAL